MLLAGMRSQERLWDQVQRAPWKAVGQVTGRSPAQAATQPSPGIRTREKPFLEQQEPNILSMDFSSFCSLLILLLLSESLPVTVCQWLFQQCAEGHPTPKLWEGNTADTTADFYFQESSHKRQLPFTEYILCIRLQV